MKITYFGHSHFLIEGGEYSITLDPFKNIGLKENKTESDYLFCSHEHYDHNNRSIVTYKKEVENKPPFKVIETFHDEKFGSLRGKNKVLLFNLDGKKIAFLGDLGEYDSESLISELKFVDLLLIPVGGTYTIDTFGAIDYLQKIQPKAVIPMHFHYGKSTVDISAVDCFLSKFNSYKTVNGVFDYNGESGVIYIIPQGEDL
ncbi:MAG: MBL fold metallo-hydrolase [Clostridia bacterium]|nr:MBL fold metallo-hydrolase [Clostridia bacterium]